jgi:hypothetical protein
MVDSRNRDGKCSEPSRNPLSKIDIGTISELQAVNLLIKSGFYVAKSCHHTSPFDLVAVDEHGNTLLIDVKTKTYRKKNNNKIIRIRNDKQKKMGVQIMTIDQERIEDRKDQKEFFDKLKSMLDNFPNKNMFEQIEKELSNENK